MPDDATPEAVRPMRLEAYYYSFEPTGEEMVDRVLSAVACAGKAYHSTSSWSDEDCPPYEPFLRGDTCAAQIQNAAIDAAAEVTRLRAALATERRTVEELRVGLSEACDLCASLAEDAREYGSPPTEAIERWRTMATTKETTDGEA